LLFSTSVNLKFRHFKFRAKARRLHLMRPFWRSQKDSGRHGANEVGGVPIAFLRRESAAFSAFHAENIRQHRTEEI